MITKEQAFEQTASNPQAYGLAEDASEEQVNAKREEAAQRLVAGTAANDAYWNSRGELEQLIARAQGHGTVQRGDSEEAATPIALANQTGEATVEGTAIEEPPTTAPAVEQGTTAPAAGPAPMPDNPAESLAKLRAQVESLGEVPEA